MTIINDTSSSYITSQKQLTAQQGLPHVLGWYNTKSNLKIGNKHIPFSNPGPHRWLDSQSVGRSSEQYQIGVNPTS